MHADGKKATIPTVFNEDERIYLRVWFCHNLASPFERLNPDRRVVNPALLGIQSCNEDIILYVDAVNGNDANNGLTTDTAKQTIQAAWNLIPALCRQSITIQVFDGIYRESGVFRDKTVVGDASISIIGNIDHPENVIFSGADAEAPTVPVRSTGFNISRLNRIYVKGMRFEYYLTLGIRAADYSSISISHCQFAMNHTGIQLTTYTSGNISDVTIDNDCSSSSNADETYGIRVENSMATVIRTVCTDTGSAYFCAYMSRVTVRESTADNCRIGFRMWMNSLMYFMSGTKNSEAKNCYLGVSSRINSTVSYANFYVTYSGNTTSIQATDGSVIYD
ncbi:hypothetical protein JXA32_06980 [Candidatus Sumerlaeota bacterium]|nr:hypothetical protein [Candidatus Sumerlaeota bacterium]